MENKIFFLTAVHNNLNDTKRLLKSLYEQTFKNFEVFLVDDGSDDGTSEYLLKKYPKLNVLNGDGNLWWTGSLNFGLKNILKKAKDDDYVWIVNNDCFLPEKTMWNILKCANANRKKAIVGSLVLDLKTKKIWDCGVKVDWRFLRFYPIDYKNIKNEDIDTLSTKGTLYPIRVFKEIGLFDEKHFPHYFSDYEFAIRAKENEYKLILCPESKIYNETKRTGIADNLNKEINFNEFKNILFSQKSKANLHNQYNIIRFVCPPRYRLGNFLLLLFKPLYYFLHIFPFSRVFLPIKNVIFPI